MRWSFIAFCAVLGSASAASAQDAAPAAHLSLFRTEDPTPLSITLAPRSGTRARTGDAWGCALPCSVRLEGSWELRLSTLDGHGERVLPHPIDGFGGGDYLLHWEDHGGVRTPGYVGLVAGTVLGAGAVVSFVAMLVDTLGAATAAALTGSAGHDDPLWISGVLLATGVALILLGAIGISQHDVVALRRVGPGPSGPWPRPAHAGPPRHQAAASP